MAGYCSSGTYVVFSEHLKKAWMKWDISWSHLGQRAADRGKIMLSMFSDKQGTKVAGVQ